MKLKDLPESFLKNFDAREREYMVVHKAFVRLQLLDPETGNIQLHELNFVAKDAAHLKIKEP